MYVRVKDDNPFSRVLELKFEVVGADYKVLNSIKNILLQCSVILV